MQSDEKCDMLAEVMENVTSRLKTDEQQRFSGKSEFSRGDFVSEAQLCRSSGCVDEARHPD